MSAFQAVARIAQYQKCVAQIGFTIGLLILLGCGSDELTCYPVSGVVVYENGEPAKELVNGSIAFIPQREGNTPTATGTIGEDGRFRLSTRRPNDGAIAGKHLVSIELADSDALDDDARKRQPPKVRLDKAWLENLYVTVEAKSNDLTIQVKRVDSSGKRGGK